MSKLGSMDDGGPVAILRGLRGLGALGLGMADCAQAFALRRKCKAGNVETDGTTFWSYKQPLGQWIGGKTIALDCRKFSRSTSKHQNRLQIAVDRNKPPGVKVVCRAIGERTY